MAIIQPTGDVSSTCTKTKNPSRLHCYCRSIIFLRENSILLHPKSSKICQFHQKPKNVKTRESENSWGGFWFLPSSHPSRGCEARILRDSRDSCYPMWVHTAAENFVLELRTIVNSRNSRETKNTHRKNIFLRSYALWKFLFSPRCPPLHDAVGQMKLMAFSRDVWAFFSLSELIKYIDCFKNTRLVCYGISSQAMER